MTSGGGEKKIRARNTSASHAVRAILGAGGKQARDAVVRGLAHSSGWFSLLPDVIGCYQPGGEGRVVVLSPLDYVDMALGNVARNPHDRLLVDGSVHITQSDGEIFIGAMAASIRSGTVNELPKAVVRGDLSLSGLTRLRSVDLAVTGSSKLTNLPALRELRGEVFGGARLRSTGLVRIGADFRCAGSMAIFQHPYLTAMNCEIGGELTVVSSALSGAGPAFMAKGGATFSDCPLAGGAGGVRGRRGARGKI